MEALLVKDELKSEMANYLEDAHSGKRLFTIFYIDMYLQVKTINKHRAILFIAYMEVTFLNLHLVSRISNDFETSQIKQQQTSLLMILII